MSRSRNTSVLLRWREVYRAFAAQSSLRPVAIVGVTRDELGRFIRPCRVKHWRVEAQAVANARVQSAMVLQTVYIWWRWCYRPCLYKQVIVASAREPSSRSDPRSGFTTANGKHEMVGQFIRPLF